MVELVRMGYVKVDDPVQWLTMTDQWQAFGLDINTLRRTQTDEIIQLIFEGFGFSYNNILTTLLGVDFDGQAAFNIIKFLTVFGCPSGQAQPLTIQPFDNGFSQEFTSVDINY